MQELLDLIEQYKDAIDLALKCLSFVGLSSLAGAAWWLLRRSWIKRQPTEVKVLEIIAGPGVLLPRLYGTEDDDSSLAHHRITYQQRDPDRDIQEELRKALKKKRYLLVVAPTGYGKTREAATLAQTLMLEGYLVLWIKPGWLDIPKEFPPELDTTHTRLVVFLDNLNHLFRFKTLDPRSEKEPMLGGISYHNRLLKFLDNLEDMYLNELYVIATARDEEDEWQVLSYDPQDQLWGKFELYEMPTPQPQAYIDLFKEDGSKAGIPYKEQDLPNIARANHGAFKNAVQNLQRLKILGKELSTQTYIPTPDGSWNESYERAVRVQSSVRYIYDGIDMLRQVGIDLFPELVEKAALQLWRGNTFQRIIRERQIRYGLRYLTTRKKIMPHVGHALAPHDGQIEAKQTKTDWKPYDRFLVRLILDFADQFGSIAKSSLWGLGVVLYDHDHQDLQSTLWQRIIQLDPNDAAAYSNLGLLLDDLDRPGEAEAAYRQAIDKDPNDAYSYSQLGLLLRTAGRLNEAIPLFKKSQQRLPRLAPVLNLAGIYKKLDDIELADKYTTEARSFMEPNDWYNLACLESICGNTDLAVSCLTHAAQQEGFDRNWAWKDPDLEWIHDDPRFESLISGLA